VTQSIVMSQHVLRNNTCPPNAGQPTDHSMSIGNNTKFYVKPS